MVSIKKFDLHGLVRSRFEDQAHRETARLNNALNRVKNDHHARGTFRSGMCWAEQIKCVAEAADRLLDGCLQVLEQDSSNLSDAEIAAFWAGAHEHLKGMLSGFLRGRGGAILEDAKSAGFGGLVHVLHGQLGQDSANCLSRLGHRVRGNVLARQIRRTPSEHVPEVWRADPSAPEFALDLNNARARPRKIFLSYSHKDEELREKLEAHLSLMKREGLIDIWHDRCLKAGDVWKSEIDRNLEAADIILLLISPDFLASDYCYDVEMRRTLEKHETRQALVIPVILKPVDWKTAPFARIQATPKDGKAVTSWPAVDDALADVAKSIRIAISSWRTGLTSTE